MQFFFLILIMVVCSGCNKHFKKLHGLSLHRNKCLATQSGPGFEQVLSNSRSIQKQIVTLKFRGKEEEEMPSPSDPQEIDEPDLVRIFKY